MRSLVLVSLACVAGALALAGCQSQGPVRVGAPVAVGADGSVPGHVALSWRFDEGMVGAVTYVVERQGGAPVEPRPVSHTGPRGALQRFEDDSVEAWTRYRYRVGRTLGEVDGRWSEWVEVLSVGTLEAPEALDSFFPAGVGTVELRWALGGVGDVGEELGALLRFTVQRARAVGTGQRWVDVEGCTRVRASSCVLAGLDSGAGQWLRVHAEAVGVSGAEFARSAPSVPLLVRVPALPAAVALALEGVEGRAGALALSWSVDEAQWARVVGSGTSPRFDVELRRARGPWVVQKRCRDLSVRRCVLRDLSEGAEYALRVRTYPSSAPGRAFSSYSGAVAFRVGESGHEAPPLPTALEVDRAGPSSFVLIWSFDAVAWRAVTGDGVLFSVEILGRAGRWTPVAECAALERARCEVSGLDAATRYRVRVVAYSAASGSGAGARVESFALGVRTTPALVGYAPRCVQATPLPGGFSLGWVWPGKPVPRREGCGYERDGERAVPPAAGFAIDVLGVHRVRWREVARCSAVPCTVSGLDAEALYSARVRVVSGRTGIVYGVSDTLEIVTGGVAQGRASARLTSESSASSPWTLRVTLSSGSLSVREPLAGGRVPAPVWLESVDRGGSLVGVQFAVRAEACSGAAGARAGVDYVGAGEVWGPSVVPGAVERASLGISVLGDEHVEPPECFDLVVGRVRGGQLVEPVSGTRGEGYAPRPELRVRVWIEDAASLPYEWGVAFGRGLSDAVVDVVSTNALGRGTPGAGTAGWSSWAGASAGSLDAGAPGAMSGSLSGVWAGVHSARAERGLRVGVAFGSVRGSGALGDYRFGADLSVAAPYAVFSPAGRWSLWAAPAVAAGHVDIEGVGRRVRPEARWRALAGGARSVIGRFGAGGGTLSVVSDLYASEFSTRAVSGLGAARARAKRARGGLDFVGGWVEAPGARWAPSAALRARVDAGDGATGLALEGDVGVRFASGAFGGAFGAQALLLGSDEGLATGWRSLRASVRFDPGAPGRGMVVSVAPRWDAEAASGVAARLGWARLGWEPYVGVETFGGRAFTLGTRWARAGAHAKLGARLDPDQVARMEAALGLRF